MKYLFICWILFFPAHAFAQVLVQGAVIDAVTKQPIAGASVFLANTTKGASSNAKGAFMLEQVKNGKYELIASSINYQQYSLSLQVNSSNQTLVIALQPSINTLKEVVVEAHDDNGWDMWGDNFKYYFLGTGPLSKNCVLLNPEVLKFKYSNSTNKLKVFTNDQLVIENRDLGYRIRYSLSKFEIDFTNNTFAFKGYPFFEEMKPANDKDSARWNHIRNETYRGSLRQFIRSLYRNTLARDGFEIRRVKNISSQEKSRVKEIMKKWRGKEIDSASMDGGFKDSLAYYTQVKKMSFDETRLVLSEPVSRDTIVFKSTFANDTISKSLYFKDDLEVTYLFRNNPPEYAKLLPKFRSNELVKTTISLRGGKPVAIYPNGNYYNGFDLLIDGYWTWFENTSTLLPTDFTPKE